MLDLTGLRERASDPVAELSGGNRQRVNVAVGLLAGPSVAAARRALRRARPAPARTALGGRRAPRGGGHRGRLHDARRRRGRSGTPIGSSCSPTARCSSTGRLRSSPWPAGPGWTARISRPRSCASSRRGPLMRWLLAQGPADPAALAAARRRARPLPGDRRAAHRPGALARPRRAEDRGAQRDPERRPVAADRLADRGRLALRERALPPARRRERLLTGRGPAEGRGRRGARRDHHSRGRDEPARVGGQPHRRAAAGDRGRSSTPRTR